MTVCKTFTTLSAAALAAAVLSGTASAQSLIFQAGTETGSRYNPQANAPLPGGFTQANTIAFTNCIWAGTNTSVQLSTLTFGIRQLAGAPAVTMRVYIAEMDGSGNLAAATVRDLGTVAVDGSATSQTRLVTVNTPAGTTVNLNDLGPSGNSGFAGFMVGIRFEGANATSALNGWRVTNTPALGAAFNYFTAYDPTVAVPGGNFSFTAPTPSYMYVNVTGALIPAPGALALLGVAGLAGGRRRR